MENNLKFNSAICTSKVQSERLLTLGLKKETADMGWGNILFGGRKREWIEVAFPMEEHSERSLPAWSLARLVDMMPTMIERHNQIWELSINGDGVIYFRKDTTALIEAIANNVYDNMVSCIEWLIKEGYFNKEYLVDQEAIEEHCKGVMEYLDYIRGED